MKSHLKLSVMTFRSAGLEAKWGRKLYTGAPIVLLRDPSAPLRHQRESWWRLTDSMWADMQKQPEKIRETFRDHTHLASVRA